MCRAMASQARCLLRGLGGAGAARRAWAWLQPWALHMVVLGARRVDGVCWPALSVGVECGS